MTFLQLLQNGNDKAMIVILVLACVLCYCGLGMRHLTVLITLLAIHGGLALVTPSKQAIASRRAPVGRGNHVAPVASQGAVQETNNRPKRAPRKKARKPVGKRRVDGRSSKQELEPSEQLRLYLENLKALSMSRDPRAAHKATSILRKMTSTLKVIPPAAFTSTIVAWSKSRDCYNAAVRAQNLLDEMKKRYESDNFRVGKINYTAVITAWSRSQNKRAGTKALALLEEMKASDSPLVHPGKVAYSACINAVAKQKDGVKEALRLLEEMKHRYKEGDIDCEPDPIVYTTVISACADSMSYRGDTALQLLHQMESEFDAGAQHLKPNQFSYCATIAACVDRKDGEQSIVRAEQVLQHMMGRYTEGLSDTRPETAVYNAVLNACSSSQSLAGAAKAMSILREMYDDGICKPDRISYSTVISAHARSGDPGSAQVALDLLREMQERAKNGEACSPNAFVYGATIAAQAKCGDADTAQLLFDELQCAFDTGDRSCRPNTIIYNSLISAWQQDGARASTLLQEMYRRFDAGERHVKPNTRTHNYVLGALAASKSSPEPALAILEDMKRRTAAGEPRVRPDSVSYGTLIGMLTECTSFEASQQIETLLAEMESLK